LGWLAITLTSFTSPVSGEVSSTTVIVTNLTDLVNGDTSSITTLINNPGSDGISLREAIQAVNNTAGSKKITFDSSLSGSTIVLQSPQAFFTLTSGDTLINGDLDGDGTPDITIDGVNGDSTHIDMAFVIRSGGNTIQGFSLVNFYSSAIRIGCDGTACSGVNLSNNKILGNIVNTARGGGFAFSILSTDTFNTYEEANNITIDSIEIRGNHVVVPAGAPLFIALSGGGASFNTLTNLVIKDNYFSGAGINLTVITTDCNSFYYHVPLPVHYSDHNVVENVTIENNVIEPSGGNSEAAPYGVSIGAADDGNSDNRMSHVIISGNTIGGIAANGLTIQAAADFETTVEDPHSSSNNQVDDVQIYNNHFTITNVGIRAVTSGSGGTSPSGTGNVLKNINIHDNEISGFSAIGILVTAGIGNSYNNIQDIEITHNQIHTSITDPSYPVGIYVVGGGCWCSRVSGHNEIRAMTVTENTVNVFNSLVILGGNAMNAEYNLVEINYSGNTLNGDYPISVIENAGSGPGNRVVPYLKYKVYLAMLTK
jgi:hypothetical protein